MHPITRRARQESPCAAGCPGTLHRQGPDLSSRTAVATESGESRVHSDPDWVGKGSGFCICLQGCRGTCGCAQA